MCLHIDVNKYAIFINYQDIPIRYRLSMSYALIVTNYHHNDCLDVVRRYGANTNSETTYMQNAYNPPGKSEFISLITLIQTSLGGLDWVDNSKIIFFSR